MTGDANSGIGQRWLLVAVSVTVICTDQAVKWWAWRHVDGSLINSGGYILLGPGIRSWFAGPVSGALSDVIGGVVDFIPGGGPGRCNVADLWIVVGALLLAYALARRLIGRPIQPGSARRPSHPHRALDRVAVLIVLLAVVILAITSALDR